MTRPCPSSTRSCDSPSAGFGRAGHDRLDFLVPGWSSRTARIAFAMKHPLSLFSVLALSVLALASCSVEQKAAPVVSSSTATPAPAAAPKSETPEPATAPKADPAHDPANAKGAGQRYQGGLDTLDTHDLSKVKVQDSPAAVAQETHDEHDGHDHAAEGPTPQDGSSLLPAAQAAANKGRLSLRDGAPQTKEFGKLRQGDVGTYDFPFVSDGEDALVITGVKPSCGCTKAEVMLVDDAGAKQPYTKGAPIAIGQKFVLETEINTEGRQGNFSPTVSIFANDARGTFNVRLSAEVEPVLKVTPSSTVYFGRITTADTAEQTVTVTSSVGEPFVLSLNQEAVQEPLKLEYTAKNPDAEGRASEWEIKVSIGPNTEIGMRNYPLNFKSDLVIAHPKYPDPEGKPQYHGFMMNVQAQVTGMVSADPAFITFGMVRPGEPVERALRIQCHDKDGNFRLTSDLAVVFEGLQGQEFPWKDRFKTTVEVLDEGKAADFKVRLEGLPEDLNGSFGGVIKIKVGHPFMDELLVRFSGVCRPGLPPAGPVPQAPAPK